MKKNFVLAIAVALCAMAISASAQKGADLSGTWNLDIKSSELGQQAAMIKSQTLTITQKDGKLTVSTKTERNAPPADTAGGAGGGGGQRPVGGGGGMGGGGGAGEQSYTLDGKEVSTERQGPNGAITIKTKAELSGNKVTITTVSPGPNGDTTTTTTYELSSDGKGLTVNRENPRGKTKSVYTKG
jgi:hypothetical protein